MLVAIEIKALKKLPLEDKMLFQSEQDRVDFLKGFFEGLDFSLNAIKTAFLEGLDFSLNVKTGVKKDPLDLTIDYTLVHARATIEEKLNSQAGEGWINAGIIHALYMVLTKESKFKLV